MRDFIDLPGASGCLYRFRRASEPNHTAGNFAIVKHRGQSYEVMCIGYSTSLAHAPYGDAARQGLSLYLRLNVSERVRLAEHADLHERWPEAQVLGDDLP